jgi:glycosyltransferase involved in cell wall biosynthesis
MGSANASRQSPGSGNVIPMYHSRSSGTSGRTSANISANSSQNEFITSTGFLPYREMYEKLNEGAAGLLVFQPTYYNISIGLPNKLFDYMLLGLPVIASDLPEIRSVVGSADCGILVDPGSVSEIADAIIYFFDHPKEAQRMGANGRRAVLEKYNWSRMEADLLQAYRNLDSVPSPAA